MERKGFSIFEILISMIILSVAITGMITLYTSSKMFLLHGRSTFAGTELGKNFLEPLRLDVRQDEWGTNCVSSDGTNTGGCSTAVWTVGSIGYHPSYVKSLVGATSLRRVTLNVTWTEPNQ
jgi:prepilin-type N-terminal cleavage/methylation domain-containing protein